MMIYEKSPFGGWAKFDDKWHFFEDEGKEGDERILTESVCKKIDPPILLAKELKDEPPPSSNRVCIICELEKAEDEKDVSITGIDIREMYGHQKDAIVDYLSPDGYDYEYGKIMRRYSKALHKIEKRIKKMRGGI